MSQDATPMPWVTQGHQETLVMAANEIARADAIVIGAGAGFSTDSGLPDFRGTEGFWKAYPPAKKLGMNYGELAGGPWLASNPKMAWGFTVHCHKLFESHEPHEGYFILQRWVAQKGDGWVYTSNVDRYFQRSGFDPEKITEIHGFRNILQCIKPCTRDTWPADLGALEVDEETLALTSEIPRCPHCGDLARTNTLMFSDQKWVGDGTRQQEHNLTKWFSKQGGKRIVVIELGAGPTVPNVRFQCELYSKALGTPLIRINPGNPEGPEGTLSLPMPALQALRALDALMPSASS